MKNEIRSDRRWLSAFAAIAVGALSVGVASPAIAVDGQGGSYGQGKVTRVQAANVQLVVAGDATARQVTGDDSSASAIITLADKASSGSPSSDSIVDLAVATGMPRVAAERAFGEAAALAYLRGGPPGRDGQAKAQSRSMSGAISTSLAAGSYLTQYCASVTGGSGNRVHGYGCALRYLDYANGADWYIADEMTASGTSDNNDWLYPDRLTSLRFSVTMPVNNVLVKWSPTSTSYPPSSCTDKSTSVTSPKSGASYSSSQSVCADKLALHT